MAMQVHSGLCILDEKDHKKILDAFKWWAIVGFRRRQNRRENLAILQKMSKLELYVTDTKRKVEILLEDDGCVGEIFREYVRIGNDDEHCHPKLDEKELSKKGYDQSEFLDDDCVKEATKPDKKKKRSKKVK
jgi:hypothetical protein